MCDRAKCKSFIFPFSSLVVGKRRKIRCSHDVLSRNARSFSIRSYRFAITFGHLQEPRGRIKSLSIARIALPPIFLRGCEPDTHVAGIAGNFTTCASIESAIRYFAHLMRMYVHTWLNKEFFETFLPADALEVGGQSKQHAVVFRKSSFNLIIHFQS